MNLEEAEAAIDSGNLEVEMATGRWWKVRRNGRTQTWKSRPGEYRIPFKTGLRTCGQLTHLTQGGFRVAKQSA